MAMRRRLRSLLKDATSTQMMDQFKSVGNAEEKENDRKRKSADPWKDLLKFVDDNILFSHLDTDQRLIVCSEMYRSETTIEQYLIKQGNEGNTFCVVEKSEFEITVTDVGKVDTLVPGRCVGELGLLYNAPRAASVQCVSSEDGVVWCVDRSSFRKALMEVHHKSSSQNIQCVKKCDLLQLIDGPLEFQSFSEGDVVFKLGDEGDRFYIVKSGTVSDVATDGSKFNLSVGAFFGERVLIKNEPRAATITCANKEGVKCLTLSRDDFTILLGPLDSILNRNLAEYEKPAEICKNWRISRLRAFRSAPRPSAPRPQREALQKEEATATGHNTKESSSKGF